MTRGGVGESDSSPTRWARNSFSRRGMSKRYCAAGRQCRPLAGNPAHERLRPPRRRLSCKTGWSRPRQKRLDECARASPRMSGLWRGGPVRGGDLPRRRRPRLLGVYTHWAHWLAHRSEVGCVSMPGGAMMDAALDYLEHGCSVVPLHSPTRRGCSCWKGPACPTPGKHPRLDQWQWLQSRRPAPDEVRAWWTAEPAANVGIVTGMISRLCVLDIDPRNGGDVTLAELDAVGAVMPDDGPLVETGSLGLHHYFALEAPLSPSGALEGIDVKADGGLVVAPPSLHKSGRRYRWCRDPLDGTVRALTATWTPLPAWARWACEPASPQPTAPMPVLADAHTDDVLGALAERGLYLRRHRRLGVHRVQCPWADTHSNEDPEAIVVEPGASLAPGWGFRCLHAHCVDRRMGDVLDVLGIPRRRGVA